MKNRFCSFALIVLVLMTSCYRMRMSRGGGQADKLASRSLKASDIALPEGYQVEVVTTGLTFPTSVVFDETNKMYVLEAGYAYGEVWQEPKLLLVDGNNKQIIARGEKNGPWTGITYYEGNFYVAEGGEASGGRMLRISKTGEIKVLVDNLPSVGDHHTNVPLIKDGYIYFGQGTATNSGVVGQDNAEFGWLKRKPDFHDIPCGDVTLVGENFETENVLTDHQGDKAITGAYLPFGEASSPGQIIKGSVPCTGAILRIPLSGGKPEVFSWGLRNPFGLALSPEGKMYVTENAYDERGSRPVWGAGDVLWEVKQHVWYGWPDFSEGKPISGTEEFKPPGKELLKPLLQQHPNIPPKPVAVLGVHSSSNGLDFSRSENFGYSGQAFIAQFGDMAPKVGKVLAPVGFKVVRVDISTGVIRDFAVNKGKRNGPATWLKKGGLERPVSVKFSNDGNSLYIVDFGIVSMSEKGPQPQVNTGVIWRVVKK